jgi:AmmeMemoRadiSam system protein B
MPAREAAVAGRFYPADPVELRGELESYFHKPEVPLEAKAILVPHAGYMYSGAVAGEVFSAVRVPQRIILLGPNHTGRGASLALAPAGEWDMPLGSAWIDAEMNQSLKAGCPALQEDSAAHRGEHSLEVQLPFIQMLQPDFRFSAICIRTIDYSALESLGHAMAQAIHSMKEAVLLVASSDMTHYESAKDASIQDHFAMDRILAVDPKGLYQTILKKDISMCGFAPAVAVLIACRELGFSTGRLIR